MGKWIRRHKWLTGLIIAVCLVLAVLLVCSFYIWSKLGLIQYDDGETAPQEAVIYQEEPDAVQQEEPDTMEEPVEAQEAEDDEADAEDIILTQEDVADLEEVTAEPELPDIPLWKDSDVLNILLIGTDERSDDFSDNARSDSMILMSINKSTKEIKLVSLERAIGVPVLEGQYEGQYDWLTHIFRYGGAKLLLKTVQTCFSVDVDHYVRINFNTVRSAIDALGGVDIELTQAEANFLNDPDSSYMWLGRERQTVTSGMNRLTGTAALTYARTRAIDSDWTRVERQRKVIISVINQLKASGFAGLDELADQVLPLVQTNFTQLELAGLMLYAPTFINASIQQMTFPSRDSCGAMTGMDGRTLYAIDFDENARILRGFLYGTGE